MIVSIADAKPIPWRHYEALTLPSWIKVSIADAKPIPWRLLFIWYVHLPRFVFQSQTRSQSPGDAISSLNIDLLCDMSFNRRREANPLATSFDGSNVISYNEFQSQTRSQSPGDIEAHSPALRIVNKFQSQTRSQSPGDGYGLYEEPAAAPVSIADAKPIPWRHLLLISCSLAAIGFNRRREANP